MPVFHALLAALLFGASTPLAKWLGADLPPLLLAGLLYLGSGLGLGTLLLLRRVATPAAARPPAFPLRDAGWLAGAVLAGGVLGPALLMLGLSATDAASASLLLNLEGVFTALIAWLVFKENADRRIVLGMLLIVLGGGLLSWQPGPATWSAGAMLVVGACLCWAVDNNLTRPVAGHDAMFIACAKGLLAGVCNTALALGPGAASPAAGAWTVAAALLVGFAGYGLSLVLFVLALRGLGAARAGAYFSAAPFFGVLLSWLIWPQAPGWAFWAASSLMLLGLWLHLTERHEHWHEHEPMSHAHSHVHDAHHQHPHDFPWDGTEPHDHAHAHAALAHRHAHFPDLHHRHGH